MHEQVQVRGREHLQAAHEAGAVTIFNHVSWFDPFVLVWLYAPSGVVKGQFAKLPVISLAIRALQVGRGGSAWARHSPKSRRACAGNGLPQGTRLCMRPEKGCGQSQLWSCCLSCRPCTCEHMCAVLPQATTKSDCCCCCYLCRPCTCLTAPMRAPPRHCSRGSLTQTMASQGATHC